ncbi:MAG: hypothetical protein JRI23_13135 [Deltaproteobacteria bacterium]|nr:hypothetical protein [Deltaproteobacteria bacterium]MBW2532667.1 hypothetical protein [Deltaproteobacteria bacterium]
MLLSRFWYVLLSVGLAAIVFLLYLAATVSNRSATRTMSELLTAASNAVGWYLKDDARTRTTALIPLTVDPDLRKGLAAANKLEDLGELKRDVRHKASAALKKFADQHADAEKGVVFDALWVVDIHGRVLANVGYEQGTASKHFEMGGYALVADAIHGWIRDDAWVLNERIYRVVARPVEQSVGAAPVGAVVGAKIVDDRFAQGITERTGAAVAFFAGGTRIATGAPSSFDKADLEVHAADIDKLKDDPDYQEKGRTAPRVLREYPGWNVGAIFARMPGEAWDLSAGYVVGHRHATVRTPYEFQQLADDKDKAGVPTLYIVLGAVGAALLGLLFTLFEHTLPLRTFRRKLAVLANKESKVDVLAPGDFRGVYKKFALLINDALDKIAAQGGVERGPADLKSVLGPLPAQPQMSAFATPLGMGGGVSAPSGRKGKHLPSVPKKGDAAEASPESADGAEAAPSSKRSLPKPPGKKSLPRPPGAADEEPPSEPDEAAAGGEMDEEEEWREVYKEFLAMKKKLGEPTDKLSYEKFRGTLQRNKDALVARHGCARVRFRVYEKEGKTALKASPIK